MKSFYNEPSLNVEEGSKPLTFNLINGITPDLFSAVESIKLIKLQTTKESVIGEVSRMFIVNDTLFIADYTKSNSIFAFTLKGKFLYKIHRIGKGPGDYQSLSRVQIDSSHITILDWLSWKIIRYDLKGNLMFEETIKPSPSDFLMFDDGKYIFSYNYYTPETPFRLVFRERDEKKQETLFPFINDRQMSLGNFSTFQKTGNNSALFYYPLCDTIYEIKEEKVSAKYYLSLYKPDQIKMILEENRKLGNVEFNKKLIFDSGLINITQFLEMDDFLCVPFVKDKVGYVSLISKKDYTSKTFVQGDLTKKEEIDFPFLIKDFDRNTLLTSIEETFLSQLPLRAQERFYSHLESEKDIKLIKELKNTNNNPVICLLKLKVF